MYRYIKATYADSGSLGQVISIIPDNAVMIYQLSDPYSMGTYKNPNLVSRGKYARKFAEDYLRYDLFDNKNRRLIDKVEKALSTEFSSTNATSPAHVHFDGFGVYETSFYDRGFVKSVILDDTIDGTELDNALKDNLYVVARLETTNIPGVPEVQYIPGLDASILKDYTALYNYLHDFICDVQAKGKRKRRKTLSEDEIEDLVSDVLQELFDDWDSDSAGVHSFDEDGEFLTISNDELDALAARVAEETSSPKRFKDMLAQRISLQYAL